MSAAPPAPLAVSLGDPAGIGPEVIAKCWDSRREFGLPPFGSIEDGVRVLVMCGRDEVEANQPSFDDIYSQLNEERVNMRARRYLADLRRDAVIEFR